MQWKPWSIFTYLWHGSEPTEVIAPFPPGANPPSPPSMIVSIYYVETWFWGGSSRFQVDTTTEGSLPENPKADEWPKKILD